MQCLFISNYKRMQCAQLRVIIHDGLNSVSDVWQEHGSLHENGQI